MKLNMTDYKFTYVASDSIYTIHVDELLEALDRFMIKVKCKLKSLNPEVKEFTVSITSHTDSLKDTCDYDFSLMYANALPTHVGVLNIRISKELYMDTVSWANTIKKFNDIRCAICSYLLGMEVRLDEQTSDQSCVMTFNVSPRLEVNDDGSMKITSFGLVKEDNHEK